MNICIYIFQPQKKIVSVETIPGNTVVILGKSMENLNFIIIMSYISVMPLAGGQGEL